MLRHFSAGKLRKGLASSLGHLPLVFKFDIIFGYAIAEMQENCTAREGLSSRCHISGKPFNHFPPQECYTRVSMI